MNKIKESLEKLDLSDYEKRAYFFLLQQESLTATELAKLTEIPRSKIYTTLDKLEKKDFCRRIAGNEKRYKAINPQDTLSKQANALKKQMSELQQVTAKITEFYQQYNGQNDPVDYVEVIKNDELIIERVNQLEMQSQHTVKCLLKSPFIMNSEKFAVGEIGEFNPKIDYIYLYDKKDLQDSILAKAMQNFQAAGVDVRICNHIPLKIAIFDQEAVVINTRDKIPARHSSTAIIVHHEDVAAAFTELFSYYLQQSKPLIDNLSPQEISD
ncbi:MAG: helix-turn-helix domain-containing protein [Candidatus Cloacimonetes bacterium]|nr:helix-turn-helix domain-containing protein [Candidatus Cloacimonadota bacterium]